MTGRQVVSLCTGIGGIDLGLERAGWQIAAQVEIDPYCKAVLSRHWPEVPRFDDLTTLNPADLPSADLVAAGFPCQPVSDAGKRLAQADERWLWPDVARVVGHLRPRWVLLENVPGLLGRGLGDVLGDLAALGYDAEWCCVSAAQVGAPHRRDRVWVVAYPQGEGRSEQPQGVPGTQFGPRVGAGNRGDRRGSAPGVLLMGGDAPASQGDMADAARNRRGEGGMGNPEVIGRGRSRVREGRPGRTPQPRRPGAERTEPVLGRILDGLPGRVDNHRWPAPPNPDNGSPQHPWEPPRTVEARKVPYRARRVSALGNAVVPQIPELIGRAILDTEAAVQAPTRRPYSCQTIWYEVGAAADIERACGERIARHLWQAGARYCPEHQRQADRLAEQRKAATS